MTKKVWMTLFFILLAINIVCLIAVFLFFNQSYEETAQNESAQEPQDIEFILSNSTVESLINENIPYKEFTVDINTNGIDVDIAQQLLGFDINSSISGEPVVSGNTIIIELTDLDLAGLPINGDVLYTALRNLVDLPAGIEMSEEERAIVIDMSIFEQYFGVELQVDTIDYENDAWYFSINNTF